MLHVNGALLKFHSPNQMVAAVDDVIDAVSLTQQIDL
jgi:hypothetical protein